MKNVEEAVVARFSGFSRIRGILSMEPRTCLPLSIQTHTNAYRYS